MKTSPITRLCALALILLPLVARAQVNSGSNGSDGALEPTEDLVIDMADHPDGIYHYTSVNIPAGVTVSFIPNAGNKPVVWLVQGDCVVDGDIDIAGKNIFDGASGCAGGPGGFRGGDSGSHPDPGEGPGGGAIGLSASYATQPENNGTPVPGSAPVYGNSFILPLIGGSGGGGELTLNGGGGGGGGGAILIAASTGIELNGLIKAGGGGGGGRDGSGGSVRFVAPSIAGTGVINARGYNSGGFGRIRFDVHANNFAGSIDGVYTQGFQPIVLPAPGQGIQLSIQSIAGVAVAANPSGVLANPDVIIPAQQTNPVSVVVNCANVPLNSEITVVVQPANGASVQAVGLNNTGTAAASTATISLNMPRGGGIIYAKAVTGIAGLSSIDEDDDVRSLAQTGWTTSGERFKEIEITAALGGAQRIAYITESGKRYELN